MTGGNQDSLVESIGLLRVLDWENPSDRTLPAGAPPGWNRQWCCDKSAQIVTSPTRRGQYAARFQLNRDDPDVSASKRTEVSEALSAPRPPERNERWFGFSIFLPSDWVQDPLSPESVTQWHHVGATGPPPLALITVDGQWQVSQHWEGSERHRRVGWYETGRWTDWVFHVRWSPGSDGLVEIWRDGEKIFSEPGKNKYSDGQPVYMKFGIYKWHWKSDPSKSITNERVMYYDELRIADEAGSYNMVDPGAQPTEPRIILRPKSDVVPWRIIGASTAWEALDDQVIEPTPVDATDYIWGGGPGRVTEVSMQPAPTGIQPEPCIAKFYANTGPDTRLGVEVVWGGRAHAATVVEPGQPFQWRSIDFLPSDATAMQSLGLRFTTIGGGDSNVRAAYIQVGVQEPQPTSVVVVGPTVKVRPTDQVTGRPEASIFAAKNEFGCFQVVVQASSATIQNLWVSLAAPLSGPEGTLPENSVRIYRLAYYASQRRSDLEAGEPPGALGRWPDAMIPTVDDFYGQERNAFPITVPAGENRIAWIDILVPADVAAGVYEGSVLVAGDGVETLVPIHLTVLNFSLPSTSSLASCFTMTPHFPCQALHGHDCSNRPDDGWRTNALFTRAGLNNRITISGPQFRPATADENDPARASFERWILPLLNGTDPQTRLAGARMTSIELHHRTDAELAGWVNLARAQGFIDRAFVYDRHECDELDDNSERWNSQCKPKVQGALDAWSGARVVLTLSVQNAERFGAIAFINGQGGRLLLVPLINQMHDKDKFGGPYVGNQRPKYEGFLATSGNELWMYTSCMSHGCGDDETVDDYFNGWASYAIDAPASEARAMGWLSFLYAASGELYYDSVARLAEAWHPGGQYFSGGNGDGTLFYPGRPDAPTGTDAVPLGGTDPIPIESLRLKLIRNGYQDFEYLKFLADRGKEAEASAIARGLFPSTFEANQSDAKVEDARKQLANLVASIVGGPVP